jgi:uncharacterized protein YeaO (DUF488 family)
MLQTKCILAKVSYWDGIRISIMSRHTLNDGITPDIRITSELYDTHCPNLAPPASIVGAFYRGELSFEEYEDAYISYLRGGHEIRETVRAIARFALTTNVTFLCIDKRPWKCHRYIFAQECRMYEPNLYCMAQ